MTEYLWNPDEFSHGGPDFELALLAMLSGFCLLLLLVQVGRQGRLLAMDTKYWLGLFFRARPSVRTPCSYSGLISPIHAVPLPSPMLGKYSLPLQI